MTTLHATRGINYWSRRPVTRMDLHVGAYEDISSADVPGMTEALLAAMPGLVEHRCSIGERGGFIIRLRRGTYAPHIIEHVALELQTMMGHDVGYGRTRGGDVEGEYTLVFEHEHEIVGLRAAALALQVVQRAFSGTLDGVAPMVSELRALAASNDMPPLRQHVLCGIIGGSGRAEAQSEMLRRLEDPGALIVDVAPGFLLLGGVPYRSSDMAIVLDIDPVDVPERYRDPERAQRLMTTLMEAVRRNGLVVCPAREWELQDYARDLDCRVAVFADDDRVTRKDKKHARAAGWVEDGSIVLEFGGERRDGGRLDLTLPVGSQVAAAVAAETHRERLDDRRGAPRA